MYNKFNIGLFDKNGIEFKINDVVEFCGMEGKICFECGAFGIGFDDKIDYKIIEQKLIDISNTLHYSRYYGVYNDNFISLWEIYWNFDCEDNHIWNIEIIKK